MCIYIYAEMLKSDPAVACFKDRPLEHVTQPEKFARVEVLISNVGLSISNGWT